MSSGSLVPKLAIESDVFEAALNGTKSGLEMSGIDPSAVGASCFFTPRNPLSVMVGLVGECSGSLNLNFSERGLLYVASSLLGESQSSLNEDVIDAILETGNLVAGSIKECLADTKYKVRNISLPSMIFGQSYQVLYARGITTVSVEFELPEFPVFDLRGRFFSTTVSLLRGAGT